MMMHVAVAHEHGAVSLPVRNRRCQTRPSTSAFAARRV